MASEFISPPFRFLPLLNRFSSELRGVWSRSISRWPNSESNGADSTFLPYFAPIFGHFGCFMGLWRGASIIFPLWRLLDGNYEFFLGGFSKYIFESVIVVDVPRLYSAGRKYYICLSYYFVFFDLFCWFRTGFIGGSCFFFLVARTESATGFCGLLAGKLSSTGFWISGFWISSAQKSIILGAWTIWARFAILSNFELSNWFLNVPSSFCWSADWALFNPGFSISESAASLSSFSFWIKSRYFKIWLYFSMSLKTCAFSFLSIRILNILMSSCCSFSIFYRVCSYIFSWTLRLNCCSVISYNFELT